MTIKLFNLKWLIKNCWVGSPVMNLLWLNRKNSELLEKSVLTLLENYRVFFVQNGFKLSNKAVNFLEARVCLEIYFIKSCKI